MKCNNQKVYLFLLFPVLLFVPTILLNKMPFFMDTASHFYPYRCAVSRQILSGHVPLWTSSLYAGMPLLANPQVAIFYPPNWLFFLWPRAGMLTFLLACHIYLAGLGTYYWLRARRFPHHAALWASLIAEVNGTIWAHLQFGAYLNTMALFPLMLFFLEKFKCK